MTTLAEKAPNNLEASTPREVVEELSLEGTGMCCLERLSYNA